MMNIRQRSVNVSRVELLAKLKENLMSTSIWTPNPSNRTSRMVMGIVIQRL